jgi:hypothetical protein
MSVQPHFGRAPLEYRITPAAEEAIPVSEREINNWCSRLRNLADPVISAETWAAASLALLVAAIFGLAALPDPGKHGRLVGFYAAMIVAFAFLTSFLVWLSWRQRHDLQKPGEQLASEMEQLRDDRLGRTAQLTPLERALLSGSETEPDPDEPAS